MNSFGRIVNLGSMAVKHEVKGEAIYTASKAAVVSFSKVLAKEVNCYGITCNVVAPAALDTDFIKNINRNALNEVLSLNAVQKMGNLEEISSMAGGSVEGFAGNAFAKPKKKTNYKKKRNKK